jgi:hypothetical protein
MRVPNPTTKTYTSLDVAFAFFNRQLFGGRLPACLITMQRSKAAYGYFAGGLFGSKDGAEITDEIALNPSHFRDAAPSKDCRRSFMKRGICSSPSIRRPGSVAS